VALVALVLDVRGRDRDPALTLLGCLVDLIECHRLGQSLLRLNRRDRRRQGRLPMVDVTDRPDVHVWLRTLEFRFAHFLSRLDGDFIDDFFGL
jgi:hypothetical protein